ncbi:MAG: DUF3943 domain-containing protein [Kiritimatiellia bacterium]|nr:DUF3943 domain-containing protein [Kiritimatiellia bacterium]
MEMNLRRAVRGWRRALAGLAGGCILWIAGCRTGGIDGPGSPVLDFDLPRPNAESPDSPNENLTPEEASDNPIIKVSKTPEPDRTGLKEMTIGFLAAQYMVVGAFHDDDDWVEEGHRFEDGFRRFPRQDDDGWVFNYVLHPWVGSEYYLAARNRGWGFWSSMAYSAALSAHFEFFAENFLQPPSANDLWVTPVVGALVGEARFLLKERARNHPENRSRVRAWIMLLDPVDFSVGGAPDGSLNWFLNWKREF